MKERVVCRGESALRVGGGLGGAGIAAYRRVAAVFPEKGKVLVPAEISGGPDLGVGALLLLSCVYLEACRFMADSSVCGMLRGSGDSSGSCGTASAGGLFCGKRKTAASAVAAVRGRDWRYACEASATLFYVSGRLGSGGRGGGVSGAAGFAGRRCGFAGRRCPGLERVGARSAGFCLGGEIFRYCRSRPVVPDEVRRAVLWPGGRWRYG